MQSWSSLVRFPNHLEARRGPCLVFSSSSIIIYFHSPSPGLGRSTRASPSRRWWPTWWNQEGLICEHFIIISMILISNGNNHQRASQLQPLCSWNNMADMMEPRGTDMWTEDQIILCWTFYPISTCDLLIRLSELFIILLIYWSVEEPKCFTVNVSPLYSWTNIQWKRHDYNPW